MNDQGGAPGASGGNTDGLGRAIGFVTEFNQNAAIFGSAMMLIADIYQRVSNLEALQVSNWAMLDPEGYAVATAEANMPTTGDPYDYYEQYQDDKKTGLKKAQEVSPIYALENRMASLESMLGVPTAQDDEATSQTNLFDQVAREVEALRTAIQTAQTQAIGIALQSDQQVLTAAIAQATQNAVQQAMIAMAAALANLHLPSTNDPLYRPAQHNIDPKFRGER